MVARRFAYVPIAAILLWLAYENVRPSPTTVRITSPAAAAGQSLSLATGGAVPLARQQPASLASQSPATSPFASAPPPPLHVSGATTPAPRATLGSLNPAESAAAAIKAAVPPATEAAVCTSLSCAKRFSAEEPSWADLSFQPGINWKLGGVRGDCVAGELEYIMPKYCSPPAREPRGPWPSEARLNEIDVHSQGKPKAMLTEIVRLLGNRTLLLMGDSVMEQFYNTVQCFLRKEAIELPNDQPFLRWVADTAPLWRMGKRKKPPKLPQRAVGGARLLYARVTQYQSDEVVAAVRTADVIVLNWGLHYQTMSDYDHE